MNRFDHIDSARPLADRLRPLTLSAVAVMSLLIGVGLGAPVYGQGYTPQAPSPAVQFQDVKIEPRPGAQLPLDLAFTDEAGRPVTLADSFQEGRPVVLNLVYYECPGLCKFELNGLLTALGGMSWMPGEQFQVVTVSFDPREDAKLAAAKKAAYLKELDRPGAEAGWTFLTGKEKSIRALADAVGFRYRWLESTGQYVHDKALIIVMPGGRISRYLQGAGYDYDSETLRKSLVEASGGKVGSLVDWVSMLCGAYDPDAGRYVVVAWKVMMIGGGTTAVVLFSTLAALWIRDAKKTRKAMIPHVPAHTA